MKPRIEFQYDKQANTTNIYVWVGFRIIDKTSKSGVLSKSLKDKLRKKIISEYKKG